MNTRTERSSSLVELTKALSSFQGKIASVKKTSVNPFFHSKYADLDAVWEMCRRPLAENGLALVQTTIEQDDRMYLETLLLHISGEYLSSRYPLNPMRQVKDAGWVPSDDPQSLGSVITYARRYAMSAMLGVAADEDDDANKASHPAPPARQDRTGPARPSSTPVPVRGETCPQDGKLWAASLGGRIGHPVGNGAWHWRDEVVTAPPPPEPEAAESSVTPVEGVELPEFDNTPLGELKREVFGAKMEWADFEKQVLDRPWSEWVRLGQTIDTARTRWSRWKSQQKT